ncbi:MAG: ABC transporter ATP-binding protein [Flavobacteriaceae bacterium]|nr:ABC transporter ATP-binding protein [Flavobacteriaceae bacterium]
MSILKLTNLDIGYKEENVLVKDININIVNNKLICLLGCNGAGKSTLLKTISKLMKPINGKVELSGNDIFLKKNNNISKRISIVLTDKIYESNMTVYELVSLGRQPYTDWFGNIRDEDRLKILESLAITDSIDLKDKKVSELSDGQAQKVWISRALAQDTDIILLDEPTSHLDFRNKIKIFNLLKNIVLTTDKTVIISTHEVNLALKIAEELWLIRNDKMIEGKVDKLIDNEDISGFVDSEYLLFNKELKQFIFKKD